MEISQLDLWTAGMGGGAGMLFILLHSLLRRDAQHDALKTIVTTFGVVGILHLAAILTAFHLQSAGLAIDLAAALGLAALSFGIYALIGVCFIVYIWGPCASSIHLRLLLEIWQRGGETEAAELLNRYSAGQICDRRIERLRMSGHLTAEGGRYRYRKKANPFLIIDVLARVLQRIYGINNREG